MVSSIFNENEVSVVQGDSSVGGYLISLNFDHIFFTGSPEIGKVVMGEAAKNLTSVTLLGERIIQLLIQIPILSLQQKNHLV